MFSFSFGDLRENINAMNKIRSARPGWRVFPSTAQEIAALNGSNESAPSPAPAPQDGAFVLSVFTNQWLVEPMDGVVQDVVASLGTPRFCKLIESGPNSSRYHVEYYNLGHAAYAVSCLNGFKLDVFFIFFSVLGSATLILVSHRVFVSRFTQLRRKKSCLFFLRFNRPGMFLRFKRLAVLRTFELLPMVLTFKRLTVFPLRAP
jgi:hypothetical protein